MKQLTKFSNFIIFGFVLAIFFIIQPNQKISLELSSMLTGEDKKFYNLAEKLGFIKTFLVAVDGFDKDDLKKIKEIKQLLAEHPEITINNQLNNKNFQEFKMRYNLYLNSLKYSSNDQIDTTKELQNIYQQMLSSPFYFNLNLNDPFGIINKEPISTKLKIKNGNLTIGDYGYLAVFNINSKIDERSRIKIYTDIHNILDKYENIKFFSPVFYYVENSKKIQSDVKLIIFASMVMLGILYLVILKNFYLFINIALTLVTSVIVGQLVVTSIFPVVSIIALVFATAVTSVSIDYMFHHYLHNYYNKKLGFNKAVFYGFLTTITAFVLMSFIDFPLIQQISIFTISSLAVAYIHFSFIYPYLGIKHKEPYSKENYSSPFTIKRYKILIFSMIVIVISIFYSKVDLDIKSLDYKNEKLIAIDKFFKSNLNQHKKSAILITGASCDDLIAHSKFIKSIDKNSFAPLSTLLSEHQYIKKLEEIKKFDFDKLKENLDRSAKNVGFKDGYFSNSYTKEKLHQPYPKYTLEMLNSFGFDLIYEDNKYVAFAMVSPEKTEEVLKLDFVQNAQTKTLFENSIKKVHNDLTLFGGLTLLLIVTILVIVTKRRFLQAFTYILFPVSLILCYSWFVPLNILHMFMAFVILAIGIDYGIYMNEPTLSHNTTLAIIFSLISTFAGFGVLIISDINSLFSIGVTAVIGVFGILFLLLFQKRSKNR
ncbi:MAG: hypothetical protein U9R16_04355 [Campylobacterota bacterium]|nr:hypothetical protein [Campylobacterota bacterium]